jgi:chromosomal replication initiation ATPase DnaA
MTDRTKAEQIPFDLPNTPAMGRDDFLKASSNALAWAAVQAPTGLPAGIMVLIGPEGSGKTHLAHIWAAENGARWQSARTLPDDLPALLAAPELVSVAIDDADQVSGSEGEEALFHLVNHLRGRGQLLLTARHPVRDWGVALPDLVSRLTAAAHVALAEPDEALLGAVLVKLFNDRQLRVQPALITYLLGHMERSLAAAGAMVARLDARALETGRPITRVLAQHVLAEDHDLDDGNSAP